MVRSSITGLQLDTLLTHLVNTSSVNCLADFGNQPIFDAPLMGVADGDAPIFERLRSVVDPGHFLPRHLIRAQYPQGVDLTVVRVVAWALPFAEGVRRSNRGAMPSALYSAARNNGEALNDHLRTGLCRALIGEGYAAVAPAHLPEYDAFRDVQRTFTSTWSERHAAFAAGLGRFGLSAALITPAGINVRLGSLVTNAPLPVSPRPTEEHRAPCSIDGGAECGACIRLCPVGAISAGGLDKRKCYEMRQAVRRRFLDKYRAELRLEPLIVSKSGRKTKNHSLGCALCQCGVPCESGVPRKECPSSA